MNTLIDFSKVEFFDTVNDLAKLPSCSAKELAIVGRSNAGKSSLLNVLTNRRRLAFTSKTPGRTQFINYFSIEQNASMFLVDLPGFGYAKVPNKIRQHWMGLLSDYLAKRVSLVGLLLIMDARHPLTQLDYALLDFFKPRAKRVHIVLSKADKLTYQQQQKILAFTHRELLAYYANNSDLFSVQLFSSPKRVGIDELQVAISEMLA